jgi:hypothetical protein
MAERAAGPLLAEPKCQGVSLACAPMLNNKAATTAVHCVARPVKRWVNALKLLNMTNDCLNNNLIISNC